MTNSNTTCACANADKFKYSTNDAARESCKLAEGLQKTGRCDHVKVEDLFPDDANTQAGALYFGNCFDKNTNRPKCVPLADGSLLLFAVRRREAIRAKYTTEFWATAEVTANAGVDGMPAEFVVFPGKTSASVHQAEPGVMFPFSRTVRMKQHWEAKIPLKLHKQSVPAKATFNVKFNISHDRITHTDPPPITLSVTIPPESREDRISEFVSTSREDQNRLLQWAGGQQVPLAIVFTDIVNSTVLNHTIGNEKMLCVRDSYYQSSDQATKKHDGFEVKRLGDSVLAVFKTAGKALDYAMDLYTAQRNTEAPIRAGIHVGEVDVRDKDVFGNAVNYAARVIDAGKKWEHESGPQICLSDHARSYIDSDKAKRHCHLKWIKHETVELKGLGEAIVWSTKVAE